MFRFPLAKNKLLIFDLEKLLNPGMKNGVQVQRIDTLTWFSKPVKL